MKVLFNISLFLMSFSLFSSSPGSTYSPGGDDREIEIIFAEVPATPKVESGSDDEGMSLATTRAFSRVGSDTPTSRRPASRLSATTPTRSPSRPLREASPVVSDLLDISAEELPQVELRYVREEDYPIFKEILDLFLELKKAENEAKDASEDQVDEYITNWDKKLYDLDIKLIELAHGDMQRFRNIILELDFLGSEEIIDRISMLQLEFPVALKNLLDAGLEHENINISQFIETYLKPEYEYNLGLLMEAIIKKIIADKKYPHLKKALKKGLENLKTVEEFRNYLFSSASFGGGAPLLNLLTVESLDLSSAEETGLIGFFKTDPIHKMTLLPKEISNMLSLKSLNLSNNKIRELNSSILPESLEILEVNDNKLRKVSIKGLPNLKTIILDHNLITDIELEDLPKLETLSLIGNQIENIPNLNNLTNLKYLNIDVNKFKELNLNLPNLEYLSIDDNYGLEDLTINAPKLEYLRVEYNAGLKNLTLFAPKLKAEKIYRFNTPVQIVTS